MDLSKEGDGCYFSNTNKIYLSPLPFLCIMKDKSIYGRVDVLLPHFLHLLLKQALPPQTPLSLLKTFVFFLSVPPNSTCSVLDFDPFISCKCAFFGSSLRFVTTHN